MPFTHQTQNTCHEWGCPNHLATKCAVRENSPHHGAQKNFNRNPNKLIKQHKDQKPNHVRKLQSKKPDASKNFSHIVPPEKCAVSPSEKENVSYDYLKFSNQINRRALIDTSSCAYAGPESLLKDPNLKNPKILTLENPSFNSVRTASGQKLPNNKRAKNSFQIGPHFFKYNFYIFFDYE